MDHTKENSCVATSSNNVFFLLDEGRNDTNTTISGRGPSSARQRNAIKSSKVKFDCNTLYSFLVP